MLFFSKNYCGDESKKREDSYEAASLNPSRVGQWYWLKEFYKANE